MPGILTAVDGTELSALAQLAGLMIQGRDIKLHTHFQPLNGVPVDIDLTGAKASEIDNLLKRLLPGRVYVKDRGYACFRLFQAIVDIDSHFVCRIRDNSVYEVIEDRSLTTEAKLQGVLSVQIVWLGGKDKRNELATHIAKLKNAMPNTPSSLPTRIVAVDAAPNAPLPRPTSLPALHRHACLVNNPIPTPSPKTLSPQANGGPNRIGSGVETGSQLNAMNLSHKSVPQRAL